MVKMLLRILLRAIRIDTVVAIVLHEIVETFGREPSDNEAYETAIMVTEHIMEAAAIARKVLEDRNMDTGENQTRVASARRTLEEWSEGRKTPEDLVANVLGS